ncbi:MAG: hypothetical protein ACYC92_08460 [Candidatus Acidiferrales bacterium]
MKALLIIALSVLSLSVTIGAPEQSSNTQVPQTGRIKGALTYYFNENSGDKADVGSKVWLLSGRVEISESASQGTVWDDAGKHTILKVKTHRGTASEVTNKYKILRYTVADGNGDFELSGVSAGQYTLVIGSNHSTMPYAIGEGFTMPIGKIKAIVVELKPGETFDASTDFGMSTP